MAQTEVHGRVRHRRVYRNGPVIYFLCRQLDLPLRAARLFCVRQLREEFSDDDAVLRIGIVIWAGSLSVPHKVMPELRVKNIVMADERSQREKSQSSEFLGEVLVHHLGSG